MGKGGREEKGREKKREGGRKDSYFGFNSPNKVKTPPAV
jgi:hypothetical protein